VARLAHMLVLNRGSWYKSSMVEAGDNPISFAGWSSKGAAEVTMLFASNTFHPSRQQPIILLLSVHKLLVLLFSDFIPRVPLPQTFLTETLVLEDELLGDPAGHALLGGSRFLDARASLCLPGGAKGRDWLVGLLGARGDESEIHVVAAMGECGTIVGDVLSGTALEGSANPSGVYAFAGGRRGNDDTSTLSGNGVMSEVHTISFGFLGCASSKHGMVGCV